MKKNSLAAHSQEIQGLTEALNTDKLETGQQLFPVAGHCLQVRRYAAGSASQSAANFKNKDP